tara:strand:+ start:1059 stop:1253 length:195 start_codon:yes stop_codon:yes gene_type:complete
MIITEENFITQPGLMSDVEFISWITEQLDQILDVERPTKYDDIEETWRACIGEKDMFYVIFFRN